jgi:probable rRNA maturation factor
MSQRAPAVPGVTLINRQRRYYFSRASLYEFADRLKRRLRLGGKEFNICLVDDRTIRRLNASFLGKDKPTDVLSFPRAGGAAAGEARPLRSGNFLGEVVISVETARRNARAEGHSTLNEIRWLILHGVLHLLGYDHARDQGEMTALELSLREQLDIAEERRGD